MIYNSPSAFRRNKSFLQKGSDFHKLNRRPLQRRRPTNGVISHLLLILESLLFLGLVLFVGTVLFAALLL